MNNSWLNFIQLGRYVLKLKEREVGGMLRMEFFFILKGFEL